MAQILEPIEDRKQIGVEIKTAEFGGPIGMPVCGPFGDGLYEVRSALSHNRIARVLFYIDIAGRMVLFVIFRAMWRASSALADANQGELARLAMADDKPTYQE